MATEYFSTDIEAVRRRITAQFDALRDSRGELLFPDHRVPGTPGYNLKNLFIQEVLHWHREGNAVYSQQSPITADGPFLDEWLDFFQQPRHALRYASGQVVVTSQVAGRELERFLGTRTLPEGTLLLSESGARFFTLEPAEIPLDGREARVLVQSDTAGPGTKLEKDGALTVESSLLRQALSARAAEDIRGGSFGETDQEARFRLVNALLDPTTFEGFRVRLLAHPDVASVEMSNAVYGPGTVEAYVIPATSLPPRTLRQQLEGLWRGAGSVFVTFPDYEGVQLQIRIAGSARKDPVVSYINNLQPGQTLILNQVETLLQSGGASDAQVIAIRRGQVDEDGDVIDARLVRQATNLTAQSPRSKWYTRPEWIVFCEA